MCRYGSLIIINLSANNYVLSFANEFIFHVNVQKLCAEKSYSQISQIISYSFVHTPVTKAELFFQE